MKIKWAALDPTSQKPAPDNIELIPINITNYFQSEINNSSDSSIHVVKNCVTGENEPIFTLNQTEFKECVESKDCSNDSGNSCSCPIGYKQEDKCKLDANGEKTGKCKPTGYFEPKFSGATGTGFAPGGYLAAGILHNKLYVWDNKTFYVGAQNATYDASKEMGVMVRNCPAMGEDANRVLNSYIHIACQLKNGKVSKSYSEGAEMNKKLGKPIFGSKIATDINMDTPLPVVLVPTLRPDGDDQRPRFTSKTNATCFLTNCPQMLCRPANRTYDLEAVLCTIRKAKDFCFLETYDYMEFTKFMACQQSYCGPNSFTQYAPAQPISWENEPTGSEGLWNRYNTIDPSTGKHYPYLSVKAKIPPDPTPNQKTGPQVQFLLMRDVLYEAALRGVHVRMIVGERGVQPCGDNADKIMQLRALEVATNKAIEDMASTRNIKYPGSIKFKYFAFMCSDTQRACYGAFHCKWIVTERSTAISTSNYTGDYFAFTMGSTFVVNVDNADSVFPMRDDLVNIFRRDWYSSRFIEDLACQCQVMGWPFMTPLAPDMLSHYFVSTPNSGLDKTIVKSIINKNYKKDLTVTSADFCNPDCFKQLSSSNPLPNSSCFSTNSSVNARIDLPTPFTSKNTNSFVDENGMIKEKVAYFPLKNPQNAIKNIIIIIIGIILLILIGIFLRNMFIRKSN
jgi:hypothetical protein